MRLTNNEIYDILKEVQDDIATVKHLVNLNEIEIKKFKEDLIKLDKIMENYDEEIGVSKHEILILRGQLSNFIENNDKQLKIISNSLDIIKEQNDKTTEYQHKQEVYNQIWKIVVGMLVTIVTALILYYFKKH